MTNARQRQRQRLLFAGAVLLAALASAAAASGLSMSPATSQALGRAGSGDLKAFQRPARAGDAVPRWALGPFERRFGPITASRRVAAVSGFRGRSTLYLVRLKRHYTCLINLDHGGAGGGCSPSSQFLSSRRQVAAGAGNGFFHGVVANHVARVAFVDPHGRLHDVRLTRDKGFLYVCRARNGCVDVITAVNGYNARGRLVSHERW